MAPRRPGWRRHLTALAFLVSLVAFVLAYARPSDDDFVRSIFTRDGNPDAYDPKVVERFADQVLALDDSMPTGTYVDMSASLPCSTRRRSGCRPRSCAASGTALPPTRTPSTSSSGLP